jgi:hypothetical protein
VGVQRLAVLGLAALLGAGTGCGRIGYEQRQTSDATQMDADTGDGGDDPCVPPIAVAICDADGDGTGGDADPDNENPCVPSSAVPACYAGPGCPGLPFGTPVLVAELSPPGSEDQCAFLSSDGLEMLFTSDRGGGGFLKLWRATRVDPVSPFDPPSIVADLSVSGTSEYCPVSSLDGLELFFYRDSRIRRSTRTSVGGPFSPDVEVMGLDGGGVLSELNGPFVTPDGLSLYYSGRTAPGGRRELAVARRANVGASFVAERVLSEVTAANGDDGWPTVSGNELELYFESSRICAGGGPCVAGPGTGRIFRAVRTSTSLPFGPPVEVSELSIGDGSGDPRLSPDGNTMVLLSNSPGGSRDIYMSKRACNP